MVVMKKDKEFAILVGKAFLYEMNVGNKESAVAFGRAFLLALGMQGPEPDKDKTLANGRPYGHDLALAEN